MLYFNLILITIHIYKHNNFVIIYKIIKDKKLHNIFYFYVNIKNIYFKKF